MRATHLYYEPALARLGVSDGRIVALQVVAQDGFVGEFDATVDGLQASS